MAKRLFDIFISVVAIVALSLAFVAIALAVRTRLGSPILFRQRRPGLRGKPFHILKFRTMTDRRDAAGILLPDHDRLTSFGAFLRSTSLDELPSLFNVAIGDMSLVGPRPLLMHYLPLYSAEQARRHDARPGLTGLAQVSGRNALNWDDRLALDCWYVDNQSFSLDLSILWKTIRKVIRREGIAADGNVTMPEFTGSPHKDSNA